MVPRVRCGWQRIFAHIATLKRRGAIRQAAEELLRNAQRTCAACCRWVRKVETVRGLPCEWCGTPTDQPKRTSMRVCGVIIVSNCRVQTG
jgi:hypothetical protein